MVTSGTQDRRLLKVLDGEPQFPPPLWLMRQAGRYLPEYRKVRAEAGSFLDLCYRPELATEVTLQPVRRYGFDAAILFSDILVIPDALGRSVRFVEGEGPRLDPLDLSKIGDLEDRSVTPHLEPVLETVSRVRSALPDETTLLGFCGAPWTVATYMIAGKGTPEQTPARTAILRNPDAMDRLMDVLVKASVEYLVAQLRAGADAVQIFDSWAGSLDDDGFRHYALAPVRQIVEGVRAEVPGARIIGFPKGVGSHLAGYATETGVNAVGADWSQSLDFLKDVQTRTPVQGNLDPLRVVEGGASMLRGIDHILEKLGNGPFIFNLGHGITPDANPEHVTELVHRVRQFKG